MNDADLLARLGTRLEETRPALDRLEQYYTGTLPLAFLAPEVAAAVGDRLRALAINWSRLVVGSLEERLDVTGFRLGPDDPADAELWRIWQANGLDEASGLAHIDTFVLGRSYVMVWSSSDPATPRVTVESARQVTVQRDPATGRVTAALKQWATPAPAGDGRAHAVLLLPDRIVRYTSDALVPDGGLVPGYGWTAVETIPNPLGEVPVVPIVNRPRLMAADGESELADVLPLADAVNKLATDLMVSAEYHAMPRRWATGVQLPEDDLGEPDTATAFSNVAGRAWLLEDPDARIGQFPEANLDGFLNSIRTFTHAIAALFRSASALHRVDGGGRQPRLR